MITISEKIYEVCPQFEFRTILCKVHNTEFNADLWKEIDAFSTEFCKKYEIADISKFPAILSTRQVYKALGKEPNRYRPSAESLCRRILQGKGLYKINTLVDVINLLSLKTGYSIGGFDADKIEGNLELGVGRTNEEFYAIGRGLLNIENLPVYRDNKGGIATPTSDVDRTKISLDTQRLLVVINGYSGKQGIDEAAELGKELITRYC